MRRVCTGTRQVLVESVLGRGNRPRDRETDPAESRCADRNEKRLQGLDPALEVPQSRRDQILPRKLRFEHREKYSLACVRAVGADNTGVGT